MKFRMNIEVGDWSGGFNGTRGTYVRRDVKTRTFHCGPFFLIQSGLPFCREAAGRAFDRMDNGPLGATSRLRCP
jgi:hypothetical protein